MPILRSSFSKNIQMFTPVLLALLGLVILGTRAEAQVRPLPVEDVARLSAISGASLSLDGSMLVGLIAPKPDSEKPAIAVWNLDDPSAAPRISVSTKGVRFLAVFPLKAGKILVVARKIWTGQLNGCGEGKTVGNTKTFVTKIFVTDATFKKFEDPFDDNRWAKGMSDRTKRCMALAGGGGIEQGLPLDETDIIISRRNSITLRTDYLRYNLQTGKKELIHRDLGSESAQLFDARTGELLTKSLLNDSGDEFRFEIKILNQATGAFEVHDELTVTAKNRHKVSIVGRDEKTGKFYVVTDQFSDRVALYLYDAVTKKYDAEPVFTHTEFSVSGVVLGQREDNFGELLGVNYNGAHRAVYWLDPEFRSVATALEKNYPGLIVNLVNTNKDMSRVLFNTESSASPPVYYLFENKRSIRKIGASRPWLDTAGMQQTQLVHYPARDGLSIPGLMTLPWGWKAGDPPPPAIILPHGGPWSRDFAGWDISGWVPFLTSRGFTVLQPQYRGSDGWGRELWLAGDGEWGKAMQDDKDDGAQWMVDHGYADQNRMAMFGYSYGGFAAFAAVVRENSPYRCSIAGAGVSNLGRIGRNWSENSVQRAFQGRTVKGMDPMKNTAKANIPMLIIHGDRDVRVPIFHSKTFHKDIRKKVSSKLVTVKDMPHSLPWTPDQQRQMLSEIDTFLAGGDCGLVASR